MKKLQKLFVVTFALSLSTIYAQNNNLENYWKVGVRASINQFFAKNQDNPLQQKYADTQVASIGIEWNVYQFGQYNIKTGITANFNLVKSKNILKSKNGNCYQKNLIPGYDFYSIPIMIERYFPINKNYWNIGIGIDNGINLISKKENHHLSYNMKNGEIVNATHRTGSKYFPTLLLKLGYNITTEFGMFEIDARGGIGLVNRYESIYQEDGRSSFATNSVNNSYIGAGITFYPLKQK